MNRTPGSGSLHWSKDNRVSGDIVAPPDSTFPFNVEAKKHEGWSMEQIMKGKGDFFNWWSQCIRDAKEMNKTPLLIFSKNRSPIFFALRSEDWIVIKDIIDFPSPTMVVMYDAPNVEYHNITIGFLDALVQAPSSVLVEVLQSNVNSNKEGDRQ